MPEENDELPTPALVLLDIRNIFNVVSCQQLRMIIAKLFPELKLFADYLCANFGRTCVKKDNGFWFHIAVEEGFAQGCPSSPVFAALVLRYILKKVRLDMLQLVDTRNAFGNTYDNEMGEAPLVLAYVDDVNCLLPLRYS